MKLRGLASLVMAAMAATTLMGSQDASAKQGYVVFPAERQSQLTVQGTKGFQITIERTSGRVELTASKDNTTAIYVVRAKRTPADRIEATFPGRGKVSVRFHPLGRARRSPGICGGRARISQTGIFAGMVRFDGEQGFTRVAVGHARGFVYRSFKESCKGSKSNGHPATSIHLTERAKSDGRTTVFSATKPTGGSPFAGSCFYFVSQWQRRHGMTSVKVAATKAAENTFVVTGSNQPESATITPPSPFSGTASFHASPGAMAEWEGTLTVDLPGVGTVGLTGTQFMPKLCLGRSCVGRPGH